jgi:phage terminase large subunit-like protein
LWQWANDGHVKATPGNVTDYELIRKDIREICAPLRLQSIAYDRALSSYLAPGLQEDGFEMKIYSQSWGNMAPPAQYFELVATAKGRPDDENKIPELQHDGNPVARWMMSNIVMQYDRNQNHLPSKGASADKIDFIAATLNAIGQWLTDRGVPKVGSYLFDSEAKVLNI